MIKKDCEGYFMYHVWPVFKLLAPISTEEDDIQTFMSFLIVRENMAWRFI